MSKQQRYVYYDENKDDFAGITRNEKKIPVDYRYVHDSLLWKAVAFIIYRIVMTPVAYCYCKLKFGLKIVNRGILKRSRGYFLYGNHTQIAADGYTPTLAAFPVKPYVIVNPDSVALKGTETFMQMIGAMPIPSERKGLGNLISAIERRIEEGQCIAIYPEKHIWPYYTGIRPFEEVSFRYPVSMNRPAYCMTVTYQKRIFRLKPGITLYVDGPFYPNQSVNKTLARKQLRDEIYHTMRERSRNSTYCSIEYQKVKQGDRLSLLYCGNEQVAEGIVYSILSIMRNTELPIDVTILTMQISDSSARERAITAEQMRGLADLMEAGNNGSLKIQDMTRLFMDQMSESVNLDNFYTPYCLLRLFADQVPQLTGTILYLDADTVALRDVKGLLGIDMEEYELAAASDYLGRFFISPDYFNSGVLLMNMDRIRETGLLQKAREYVRTQKKSFPDQEALNRMVKYRTVLPRVYNEQRRLRKDTVIRHCCKSLRLFPYIHTVNKKPWQREQWTGQPEADSLHKIYSLYDRIQSDQ